MESAAIKYPAAPQPLQPFEAIQLDGLSTTTPVPPTISAKITWSDPASLLAPSSCLKDAYIMRRIGGGLTALGLLLGGVAVYLGVKKTPNHLLNAAAIATGATGLWLRFKPYWDDQRYRSEQNSKAEAEVLAQRPSFAEIKKRYPRLTSAAQIALLQPDISELTFAEFKDRHGTAIISSIGGHSRKVLKYKYLQEARSEGKSSNNLRGQFGSTERWLWATFTPKAKDIQRTWPEESEDKTYLEFRSRQFKAPIESFCDRTRAWLANKYFELHYDLMRIEPFQQERTALGITDDQVRTHLLLAAQQAMTFSAFTKTYDSQLQSLTDISKTDGKPMAFAETQSRLRELFLQMSCKEMLAQQMHWPALGISQEQWIREHLQPDLNDFARFRVEHGQGPLTRRLIEGQDVQTLRTSFFAYLRGGYQPLNSESEAERAELQRFWQLLDCDEHKEEFRASLLEGIGKLPNLEAFAQNYPTDFLFAQGVLDKHDPKLEKLACRFFAQEPYWERESEPVVGRLAFECASQQVLGQIAATKKELDRAVATRDDAVRAAEEVCKKALAEAQERCRAVVEASDSTELAKAKELLEQKQASRDLAWRETQADTNSKEKNALYQIRKEELERQERVVNSLKAESARKCEGERRRLEQKEAELQAERKRKSEHAAATYQDEVGQAKWRFNNVMRGLTG